MQRSWPIRVHGGDYALFNLAIATGVVLLFLASSALVWLVLGMPRDFTIPLIWGAAVFPLGCYAGYKAIRFNLDRISARKPPIYFQDGSLVVPLKKSALRFAVDDSLLAKIGWFDYNRIKRPDSRHPPIGVSLNLLLKNSHHEVLLRDPYGLASARERDLPFGLPGPGTRQSIHLTAEHVLELYDFLVKQGARAGSLP